MTLVEVVAGLALLATLLVTILLTRARYTRQAGQAQLRIQAAAVADRLLSRWWEDPSRFPRDGAGAIEGNAYLGWRTLPVPNATAAEMEAQVVRLEVVDRRLADPQAAVLVAVEVVLPQAQEKP